MSESYRIAPDGKSITCLLCDMTSYNRHDIEHHFCGNCRVFLDDLGPREATTMSDRSFTNPNVGNEVRVEQEGNEVRLIFVASNRMKADQLARNILDQLKAGALNMTLMGKPTKIEGSL